MHRKSIVAKSARNSTSAINSLTFDTYQKGVWETDENRKRLTSLLGLVGEIGDLHTIFKRLTTQGSYPTLKEDLSEELGDCLWYLTSIACLYEISLAHVATSNLVKVNRFYASGATTRFDTAFPDDERFPRKFEVSFQERLLNKGVEVKIRVNDVFIGDALTDNAHEDDGYRFHDVFHLAYAAVLGWSPVTRALLRRKRKSDQRIDEVEDGARACIVEEAVSIFIFNQASSHGNFEDKRSINLSLLKTVMNLCSDLEVKSASAKQWKNAIFHGFRVFRLLQKHGGGVVVLDLDIAEITYRKPEAHSGQPKRKRK